MLQTRNGKRTGAAAVKMACEMVSEGLIEEQTAVKRIPANDLTQLLLPSFDPAAKQNSEVLTIGLPASPGASCPWHRRTYCRRRDFPTAAAGPDSPQGASRSCGCWGSRQDPHRLATRGRMIPAGTCCRRTDCVRGRMRRLRCCR